MHDRERSRTDGKQGPYTSVTLVIIAAAVVVVVVAVSMLFLNN